MHPTSWFRPTNSGPSVANPGCRLSRSRGDTNETVKSRVAPRDSRTNDVGCRTVEPSRPLPWQKAQPMARKNFLPLADGRWRLWQTVRTRASDTASFRPGHAPRLGRTPLRSEEHTSELQSLMRISYAVFCLQKKKLTDITNT